MKIDWIKVWEDYAYYAKDHFVTWDKFKKKIQSLVEAQLKPKRKRK